MKRITAEMMQKLDPHLEQVARKDAVTPFPGDFHAFVAKLAGMLAHELSPAFDEMVGRVVRGNDRGLNALGIDVRRVPGLDAVVAHFRQWNADLITKAARDYATDVQSVFSDPDIHGLRVEEIRDRLMERGDVAESRAELIARDQSLKLTGQVNKYRQQAAGVDSYEWSTSLDERVRDSHAELEGKRFDWASPPEVGHPGEDIQCRCVAMPILPELDTGED